MELVLNNPFRVLGLPATASTRDIAKRISDLETFAELGKEKTYPLDLPLLGLLDRSLEAVKEAARKIEQVEGRLFHSFFWFRPGDSVDELALEILAAGNVIKANELWEKQLEKKGEKKYTWRLNHCVLNLAITYSEVPDVDQIDSALEDLGFVIDDYIDDSIQDVLAGNDSGLNRESLWKRVVDELIAFVQTCEGTPYGNGSIKLVESLWAFPATARDYASSRIVNPLLEKVKDAITVSEGFRERDDLEALKAKNHLERVEAIIKDLEAVLGEDDIRFQTIANAYAEEACACAIKALNKFNDPKLAMVLITWANNLPSFSRIKARIEENLETIQEWVTGEEGDEVFEGILKLLKTNISSIEQASNMLTDMKVMLAKIKAKLGASDKHYVTASSACAHHILGFLIKRVNSSQESYSITKNLKALQSVVTQATELTKKLLLLDLDGETRVRVDTNLKTIENINLLVAEIGVGTQSVSSGNLFSRIPAWLWIVGVVLLLVMCSSK